MKIVAAGVAMTNFSLKITLIKSIGLFFLLLLVALASIYFYLIFPVEKMVSSIARPAIRGVLIEYYLSDITGAYWEDKMLNRSVLVSKMPVGARVEFLREILLNCEIYTAKAMVFNEIVVGDALQLRVELLLVKVSARFSKFLDDKKLMIANWIDLLSVVGRIYKENNKL